MISVEWQCGPGGRQCGPDGMAMRPMSQKPGHWAHFKPYMLLMSVILGHWAHRKARREAQGADKIPLLQVSKPNVNLRQKPGKRREVRTAKVVRDEDTRADDTSGIHALLNGHGIGLIHR